MRRTAPYPVELRDRVLAACESGLEDEYVAEVFRIGTASISRWRRLKRERGSVAALPRVGRGGRSIDAAGDKFLCDFVAEKPGRTIAELGELLREKGYTTSDSSVSRALIRLDLTLKKRRSQPPSETDQTLSLDVKPILWKRQRSRQSTSSS